MRPSHRNTLLILFLGAMSCLLPACLREAPDTRAADEAALRDADTEWLKTVQAKHVDHVVSFYADDASMFPPGAPLATGKEAIRAAWSQLFALPGFALRWETNKSEVSRAGDLAFAQGTYETTFNDAKGKPVTDRGKWVVVWKKQADGSWKAVADIFNSDLPAPAAK